MPERDANQLAADVPEVRAVLEMVRALRLELPSAVADDVARRVDELVGLVGTLHAQGYDEGQNDVWNSPVCSVCGQNHDRDESAMCDDGEVVSLGEFVQSVGALVGTLQQERDAAWAVDRHGFQLSEPRWSILEIERWLLALGADEELRAAMAGAFRAEAAEAALARIECDGCRTARGMTGVECMIHGPAALTENEKLRAALATTRQALTNLEELANNWLRVHPDAAVDMESWRQAAQARASMVRDAAHRALADTGGDTASAPAPFPNPYTPNSEPWHTFERHWWEQARLTREAAAGGDTAPDPDDTPFERPAIQDHEAGLFGIKTYPGAPAGGDTAPPRRNDNQRAMLDDCTVHVGCRARLHLSDCPARPAS